MAKNQTFIQRTAQRAAQALQAFSGQATNAAPIVAQPTRRSGYLVDFTSGNAVSPVELYLGFAKAAINVVANRFASEMLQNLRCYDSKGNEVPLINHPLGQALLNPQFGNSTFDIWEQVAINMEVFGYAYRHVMLNEPGNKHVGIEVMPSGQVTVKKWTDDKMRPALYEYKPDATLSFEIEGENVIYTKYYNPKDPRRGYSSIAAAGDHNLTEQAAASHVKNHLYNSGFQNMIVRLKEELPPDQFEQLKADFAAMYTGAAQSGKNVFINGVEMEVTELNAKLADLDISGISKTAIDAILSSFGVSRAMIGLEGENLNRATAEVQERQLIQNKIIPMMRREVSAMNVWTLQFPAYSSGYTLGFIDPSIESVDEELVKAQTKAQKAQGVAVLVAAGETLENAKAIMEIEEDGTEQRASNAAKAKQRAVNSAKSRLTARKWKQWQKTHSEPRIAEAEKALVNGLERHYQNLRAKILRQFKKDNAFGVSDVFVIDEAAEVAAEIRPGLMDLYGMAGKEAMALMWELSEIDAVYESPFKPSQSLLERTSALIDRAAKKVSETNSELIGGIIRDGLAAEKTQQEIAQAIDDAFNNQIESWRSERLARTEVVRISNLGEQDSVQQWGDFVGATVTKTWRTNSPEPCEFCTALNGKKVSVGGLFLGQNGKLLGTDGSVFTNTYDDLETPPIHPNCACSVTMEVD